MRVVIADDELIALKMLRKLIAWETLGLKYCGYAQDGFALYDLILEKKPDLVITDIMMPGYDGLKVIAKTLEAGLATHFLITSAYANFSYAREAIRLGVEDFLEKPVDREGLNAALRRITGERDATGEKEERKPEEERSRATVSRIIQTAKDYIDEHYAEKLTLEAVADYIYLSPNYLSSLFRKEMEMNFIEYITEVRMRKAEKFLADGKMSVADAARMAGYKDAGYFCNVFTKRYGISPSAWKRHADQKQTEC